MLGLQLGTKAGSPPHLWASGSLSAHSLHDLGGPVGSLVVLLSGGYMDSNQAA